MTINDILNEHIDPFEIEDEKLKALFSYYLHLAPTIDSKSSRPIDKTTIDSIWNEFVQKISLTKSQYHFYCKGNISDEQLKKYGLYPDNNVNRKKKAFVCCVKNNENTLLECILRHLRNSIAHSNVYTLERGRKYIIFDDYNKNGNRSSRVLLSQTDLKSLRAIIEKYSKYMHRAELNE